MALRTTRKYCGTKTAMMAMAAASMPPPVLDCPPVTAIDTTMASSNEGMAYSASITSTNARSSQPPRYPEVRPSTTPAGSETTSEVTMTSSAVRAPNSTRDNTSSPRTEVPNQCCQDGACCRTKSRPSALVCENP
ncbi:Uncharacterised protein [Mycobacteroides abscessus subsp. abscessus]|nr:Uncharacterised protein [Mycobacteroides abscessus subsp. abscessus]